MPSAMTLGNVIVYGTNTYPGAPNIPLPSSPIGWTVGGEEYKHTIQGQILGPLYFPAHLLGGGTSLLRTPLPGYMGGDAWHQNNFMETGPMSGRVF